ncbi:MAG: phosphate/phosphite/phosphonate ABC transporter substrate-binding protein [Gammaproteobacteria bacterium]|nr:phosphate/phosphite/phosphonate ABC transporter substrate-binding protein [Gammaproteobacteria bacterium]
MSSKHCDSSVRLNLSMTFSILFFLMVLVSITACDQSSQSQSSQTPQYGDSSTLDSKPVYRFAIHPLHNPRKLTEVYQPLINQLNAKIPSVHFQVEASRDYQAYEMKFRAREAEFLLPNPWQTLEAIKVGYSVIAMAGNAEDFKGIFVVRNDSGIKVPTDLKGKKVSCPSPTALAACIMPHQYLHNHGVNVQADIEKLYVGSQESSIMNTALGSVAAGATWPPPWRAFQKDHPEDAAKLKVIWETPHLLNNSVMVRKDVPANIRDQVKQILHDLHKTPAGQELLNGMETARFHPADDGTYDKVRQFVARFEKEVRPVEVKK